MGWLDKTFKNVVRGGKDLLKSPAGIMLLSAAAPWIAPKMAPWMAKLAGSGKYGQLASNLISSPWVKNALTNAAVQGGIATLTRSKHPWKAMAGAAISSLPFTALQSAQAASKYNELFKTSDQWKALTNAQQHSGEGLKKWYDFAAGNDLPMLTQTAGTESFAFPGLDGPVGMPQELVPVGPPQVSVNDFNLFDDAANASKGALQLSDKLAKASTKTPFFTRDLKPTNIDLSEVSDLASSYFTKDPGAAKQGWAGLVSDVMGPVDMPAAIMPQVAGLAAGRMTDEERWLETQEAQIRSWAFQHGIPYDEAKEIWKDGWRNPYYETTPAEDYRFVNRGGTIGYKDDYTAGGKAVGPGTGTSDSIRPVALSDGEFVFTEEATNNFPGGPEGLYSLMNSLDPNSEQPHEARSRA